jgi:hypothetical protein
MPASPALPQEESLVPIQPYPDSLLYRSTVSQLEFSATALKRLTKAVIAHAAVYTRILDELEKADDELCSSLGELGRWLEAGFGVHGSVWDDEAGVRMIRRGRYRSKREEMEAMIDAPVKAVRGDLKRKGLAGGGAQDRYEVGRSMGSELIVAYFEALLPANIELSRTEPERSSGSCAKYLFVFFIAQPGTGCSSGESRCEV